MSYGLVLGTGTTANTLNGWPLPGTPLSLDDEGEGKTRARTAPPPEPERPQHIAPAQMPPISAAERRMLVDRAMAQGESLRNMGQTGPALKYLMEALRLEPENARVNLAVAICEWSQEMRDDARQHMQAALRLDPNLAFAHNALGQWYLQQGMVDAALDFSARAAELMPQDCGILAARAFVLEVAGESEAAWEIVQQLIARGFTPPLIAVLTARMARRRKQEEQALALIGQLVSRPGVSLADEGSLRYSAADMLDGLGRYDEAFAQAARANQIKAKRYNHAISVRDIDRLINYFTPRRIECLPKATYRKEKPVFIVGMPRSGTSLVEQVLASHPAVYGAGELDFMTRVFFGVLDMLGATMDDYPRCLDGLSVDKADGMAQIYLEPLAAMAPEAQRITDKMPLNFLHLGLISLLLPEARVIHCRRDPLDTCLSCYMTDLVIGHEFQYDLRHLGLFYREYERLMTHWKSVLKLPILDVQYEKLVSNPEREIRRMVEFVGLPWDERCLKFHETKRPVATASTEQVRQPVYHSSVRRWKHYEKHLGPLKEALGIRDQSGL
jgi:tetratricopeptide (TPR) repeat protein